MKTLKNIVISLFMISLALIIQFIAIPLFIGVLFVGLQIVGLETQESWVSTLAIILFILINFITIFLYFRKGYSPTHEQAEIRSKLLPAYAIVSPSSFLGYILFIIPRSINLIITGQKT